jgi:hypothetical protein
MTLLSSQMILYFMIKSKSHRRHGVLGAVLFAGLFGGMKEIFTKDLA